MCKNKRKVRVGRVTFVSCCWTRLHCARGEEKHEDQLFSYALFLFSEHPTHKENNFVSLQIANLRTREAIKRTYFMKQVHSFFVCFIKEKTDHQPCTQPSQPHALEMIQALNHSFQPSTYSLSYLLFNFQQDVHPCHSHIHNSLSLSFSLPTGMVSSQTRTLSQTSKPMSQSSPKP